MTAAETPGASEPQSPEWQTLKAQPISAEQQFVEQQMKEFADSLPTVSPDDHIVPTKETK